jgi:hypothetical protein
MNLKNKIFLGVTLLLLVVGIPAVVFLSQQRQETRSRASQSTTLYFVPSTTSSSPLRKAPGEAVSFDVMVNPGSNRPSLIRLEIPYDGTKLTPTASPFVVNTVAFPTTQEGPFVRNNSILISVSVGNDPSKAISQITKVGTVNFTAVATTTSPSMISFGSGSQVLSVASTDEANENVLSTTTPAYVSIANAPTPTPTNVPTPTPIKKAGDGGKAGNGGGACGSLGSNGSIGSNSTGGTGGTGGTGCSGLGTGNTGGLGGSGGLGSSSGAGNPGLNGANGSGTGAGGGGGGGGGGAPGQPGGRGGDGGTGCNGAPGQPGLPGEAAPNAFTGGKGGAGGAGGPACTATPTPTPTTIPTPTPTRIPTPTPTPVPNSTKLSLTVFMHGIGNSGDNANPNNFTLSNKNPLTPNRTIDIQILNSANQIIASASGQITYNSSTGNFKGLIDMGLKIPSSGSYNLKAKSPTHLRRLASGIQTITIGQTNVIPDLTLVAGDINGDNTLNILDYNLLIGCYSDLAPAVSCTTTIKPLADLNDNGAVNQFDYNLFLRELAVQLGQ